MEIRNICGVVLNLQIKNSKIQNASTQRFEILKMVIILRKIRKLRAYVIFFVY